MNRNLEQRRIIYAIDRIEQLKDYGKYVSYVSALPAAVLTNGLGQAMATEFASKNDAGHKALYAHVSGWLCRADAAAPYPNTDPGRFLHALAEADQRTYLRAQAEALALLVWLKKFARAMLESKEV